jgi:hypothetical protein
MDFGPGTVLDTAASFNTDGFLLKIGAAGNYIWHRTFKGSGDNFLGSITTDATNTIYCTGSFALNNDFDPGPGVFFLSYAGLSDGVVITLDAAGNFIRAWKPGYCTSTDIPAMIVLDEFGFIYLLGSWEGTMDFDPGPGVFQMFATGTSSKYLMKLNKYGHSLWALQVGYALSGSDFISPNTMTYDETNGLLLSGSFTLDYDFDPSPGST